MPVWTLTLPDALSIADGSGRATQSGLRRRGLNAWCLRPRVSASGAVQTPDGQMARGKY